MCSVKKVLLKILELSQEYTCKIGLKINFKINLSIHFSTVVFSCEPCGIFKNTYFVEHRQTAASAIKGTLIPISSSSYENIKTPLTF